MPNPAGEYPGRQVGLGRLKTGDAAFFYFGSGRSEESQARYASEFLTDESAIRIKPTDPRKPHDEFRHYQAVRIDQKSGAIVVSNSQSPVQPILEASIYHPNGDNKFRRMHKTLAVIGPEYDNPSQPTPRVLGSMFPYNDKEMGAFLGVVTNFDDAAYASFLLTDMKIGLFRFVPTYSGKVDYKSFDPVQLKIEKTNFDSSARSAQDLADEIYDMSDYVDPKYGELRVWCVAGVRNGNGPGGWELARRNRHQIE